MKSLIGYTAVCRTAVAHVACTGYKTAIPSSNSDGCPYVARRGTRVRLVFCEYKQLASPGLPKTRRLEVVGKTHTHMMHRLGQVITAAATAAAVATTTSAFVVAPVALRDGTRLSASPDAPRGWACNLETAAAYSSGCLRRSSCACEGGGGRITMRMSVPPPGKGKFVKMGGTEDAQSFGPR
ncbi:unnamed protein product [Ectocarpus sp. 12 AP-2014]